MVLRTQYSFNLSSPNSFSILSFVLNETNVFYSLFLEQKVMTSRYSGGFKDLSIGRERS